MRRIVTTLIILAALGALGYFGYQQYQKMQADAVPDYQTVEVTRGTLTATVGATGTVRARQSVTVNWGTTGRVKEVRVKEGDTVKKGQVLAVLDETTVPQNIILARSDLITAQRNLDQLRNSDLASAQALQTLVNAQKAYDDASKQRESKQYARASDATVEQARANYVLAQDKRRQAEQAYDMVDGLPEDDPNRAAGYAAYAAAKQQEDRALANLNYLLGRPDETEISQADAALAVAKAALDDAQREYDRLRYGPDPRDLDAAEARIEALRATLGLLDIESPIDGTVTDLNTLVGDQAGAQSATAGPAFRIDDLTGLLVDVQISEVDINRITEGQQANLAFDAIPDKQYEGTVIEVSKIGQAVQGVVNFLVTIELTAPDEDVQPGMTAAVNITTDQVDNALIVPNRAVRVNEGKRVVWVLKGDQLVMTEVQLGKMSDTASEITGGQVSEGDLLVLNPPTSAFGQNGGMRPGMFGPPGR